MVEKGPELRLSNLPVHLKVLASLFIIALGLGYLSSHLYLYYHMRMADGEPEISVADVVAYFQGGKGPSRLERASLGTMAKYYQDEAEKQQVIRWIHKGARLSDYSEISPIINANCIVCHRSNPLLRFPPLEIYEQVRLAALPEGTTPTVYELSGTTHTHLMSLAMLLTLSGFIFSFSGMRPRLKSAVILMSFAGLFADVGGWWWATRSAAGAWVSVTGGGLMGIMLAIENFWSLGSLWLSRSDVKKG